MTPNANLKNSTAPFRQPFEQSVLANIGKTVKTQDDVVRVFKEA